MANSKSSSRWLQRQANDPYVKDAQKRGLRSRAAIKLEQIQQRYRFLRPGMRVLDLGSAPGSWSEYLILKHPDSQILAVDIEPIEDLPNVTNIEMDIYDERLLNEVQTVLGDEIDLVISDIAPYISGMSSVDIPKMLGLAERVLDVALASLKKKGVLVVKVFQGSGFEAYQKKMRQAFVQCETFKPKASRQESREVYIYARHIKAT
ncbi:MAG: RlmE family RNA methyltransferase [Candidatus Oxydemutatoraceae bacterium WSBS_2016_MAG_OTU14]